METNVHYTVVGLFVICLITAITLGIIWLSSGFSFAQYSTYIVFMQESVSGLNPDAPVEFNGVNVGTVKSIEINEYNPELVELLLKVKSTTPITQGTVAALTTRGITGIAYIALKDKGNDLRPLLPAKNQPYPVIKTVPSLFVRLDATLNQLSENFKVIGDTFKNVFDAHNQQSIKLTLENLKTITNNLSRNSQKLDAILENTSLWTRRFTPLVESSTTTMKMIETQTLPSIYQLLNHLDDMSRNLAETTQEIKQNPSILIRGIDRTNLGPGEQR